MNYMARLLSAKDKVFNEKLMKERHTTQLWRDAYSKKVEEVEFLKRENISLQNQIKEMQEDMVDMAKHCGMAYPDLLAHIASERKQADAMNSFLSLAKALDSFY